MRVKRDILVEAPDATISDLAPRSEATSAEDLKGGQTVDEYPDGTPSTEDDETEGEVEAETDRDTEAEADTSVEADASHRTLTVDPFSAEEERIITVLSRKLEQVRFYVFEFLHTISISLLFSVSRSDDVVVDHI